MGFLIRRAAIRLALGGAGALGARLRGWRLAAPALWPRPAPVPAPVPVTVPARIPVRDRRR